MAQEERKAKAVLAAAVKWLNRPLMENESDAQAADDELATAIEEYNNAVKSTELPPDPTAFYCPHCDAPKPAYGWHYNAGDTGPFAVAYLTCFCGECKKILSVVVTTFMPSQQLADELMRSFKQKMAKPS